MALQAVSVSGLNGQFHQKEAAPSRFLDEIEVKKVDEGGVGVLAVSPSLFCIIDQDEAKSWPCRRTFLDFVIQSISSKYSKEKPLAFFSIGSGCLLEEYCLVYALIKLGFKDLYLFLVDPIYKFSSPKSLDQFAEARDSFVRLVQELSLTDDRIHFLSRAQNFKKYFPSNMPQVAIMESFPPSRRLLSCAEQLGFSICFDKLIGDSLVVPKANANALTFLMPDHNESLKDGGKYDYQPAIMCTNSEVGGRVVPRAHFFELGCKIPVDGKWEAHFSGTEVYDYDPLMKRQFRTLKAEVERCLTEALPEDSSRNRTSLSQEQISGLLQRVEAIGKGIIPNLSCCYLAHYDTDRRDLLSMILPLSDHHCCFSFLHCAEKGDGNHFEEIDFQGK